MQQTKGNHVLLQGFIALVFGFVHAVLYGTPFGEQLDLRLSESFFSLRGALPPPSEVAIVFIDQATLDKYQVS